MNYEIGSKYQLGQGVIVDGVEGRVTVIELGEFEEVIYTVFSDVGEFYPLEEHEIQPNNKISHE